MGTSDNAIVESALQHLGSVAEQIDHYGPPAQSGSGPSGPGAPTNGYDGGAELETKTSASKKRSKGDGLDADEKKPKKTRQTRESIAEARDGIAQRNIADIQNHATVCHSRAHPTLFHSRYDTDALRIACRARK